MATTNELSTMLSSPLNVKALTHKELIEAVDMGHITQSAMNDEMKRRKIRRAQRKKIGVTTDYVVSTKSGEFRGAFSLQQTKTELSQKEFSKPLGKDLVSAMLIHKTYGPWWTSKIEEVLKMDDRVIEVGLVQLAYSTYKTATVEYWENLIWGSRRKRDKFIDTYFYGQEDQCETQGDEPVLEETSSMSGKSNMTFLEERPTDSDSTHVENSVSTSDAHANLAESPWNRTNEILEREIVIHQGLWTHTTGDYFLSIGIPKCSVLKKNSFVTKQMSFFAFLRAGYEIRIQFNGNRFAAGSLLFAILPPMFEEDVDNYTTPQLFNFPHIRVDASVSNVGTLFVPFTHLLSHFPQRSGSLESDSMVTLGRLVGTVVNPLVVGDGAVNTLRFTVYGRFVNPELHQTTWPIEDFSYSDGIFTQAEEGLFKKIVGGGLSTALGAFLSKMTGGLATGIGSVLAGLIFDYPRDPVPAEPVLNHSVGPVCYGAGVDHSIRLALTPISQTETPAQLLGSTNGDFNMKVLLKMPSLLDVVPWKAMDVPGTLLFSCPVTPTYLSPDRVRTGEVRTTYTPTMQAYISRAFCYWRGTMKIKLQFIKTEFNNGRIMLSYSPHINSKQVPVDTVSENIDTYNQANAVIVDIEEQKEVEVELPYMSPRPWLRCDAFRTNTSFSPSNSATGVETYLAESHCGYFKMHVMNSLTAPSNVPQDISINVLVSVGDDFELAYPTNLAPLNITSFGVGSAGAYEEYPFVLDRYPSPFNQTSFDNKEWITAAFYDGKRLFEAGKLFMPDKAKWWYEAQPVDFLGSADEETVTWCYKTRILGMYGRLNNGPTLVQTLYMQSFGQFRDEDQPPTTQGLEEYTTNRVSNLMTITTTKGHKSCEVAPETVSENGMNLQTILRRFYCIYTSPPLYHHTGFTLVAIPVNPSFTPIARAPITTSKGSFFAEPVPMDQVAWFTKLFTYWRGSLRYKIVYDSHFYDVNAVHVPTECASFGISAGVKEVDITRIMSFAGVVATTQTQGSLEVEVPYAAPYEQQLIDVHNKYFDLRCQNGTLFFIFRNKMSGATTSLHPTSFQLYRSTGDDFVMNIPRSPPQIDEPKIAFGACSSTAKVIVPVPEAVRNLGNNSQKLTMPQSTGIKYVTGLGSMQYCEPSLPAVQCLEEEGPVVQMFDGLKNASSLAKAIDPVKLETIVDNTERMTASFAKVATSMEEITADGKIKETLQSLNGVTSKIDNMFEGAQSIANGIELSQQTVTKYAIIASEVLLCGTFVHQVRCTLLDPTLPNFCTLGVELGLIVGLSVSETMQSLVASVVNWAMNIEILPKAPVPQSLEQATDFIDSNQKTICSVVAVIGTVLYAYLFDVIPSFEKIKKAIKSFFESDDAGTQGLEKALGFNLRNAHFAMLGISALDKVYSKIVDWIQKLVYWFLDQENPEVMLARSASELKDRVLALIAELDELDYEPNFLASMANPLVHNRYYKLQDEVQQLTKLCTDSKIDSKVVNLLTECRRRSQKLLNRLEKESVSNNTRYDPFVVCLHGDTGVGKTAFAMEVIKVYQEVMNLPTYHLMYPKQIHDKFWSRYSNQPVVLWDEFGQSVEADKIAVPEFMTLRGSRPVKLNMGENEDKGRDFTSQGIVMTTNVPYVDYNSIRDNAALKRRRHVMVGMAMNAGYNANRVSELPKAEYETYNHCRFAITQNDAHVVVHANQSKDQILDFIRRKMTVWHQKQLDILEGLTADELPRGIIPIPEEELAEGAMQNLEQEMIEEEENLEQEQDAFEEEVEMFWDAYGQAVEEEQATIQTRDLPLGYPTHRVARMCMFRVDPDISEDLSENELFAADLFLSRMEYASARKVCLTYKSARNAVTKKVSRMYDLAVSTFETLKQKILNFWKNNTRLCKILGLLGVLTTVGAIMHFRTPREVEVYESGPSRAMKVKTIAENSYESGPTRAPKTRVIAEGSDDPQIMEISRKVKQYVYPIRWSEGSTRTARMSCMHVGGRLVIAPMHFFTHALEGEWFEVRHRNKPVKIEFLKERMSRISDKDWVLYDCGVRLEAGKKMFDYFIEEKQLSKISSSKCMLITRDPKDWELEIKSGVVKSLKHFKYSDPNHGDTYQQVGWEHNLDTQTGHCGSPLLVVNSAIPSPGKILGIHVAGYASKSVGYCVLVSREQIRKAAEKFGPLPGEAPVVNCVEIGYSNALRIIPEGDFTLVGRMPDRLAPAQPLKTTLEKTPFFDEVVKDFGPPEKKPALLRQFTNEDGERISPLKNAIVKYGHLTIPYPKRNIKKVKSFLIHYFDQKLKHHTGKRVFSEIEAVNGLPGVEFAEKLNFKSSPGWPYQMETKSPGKWHLFDDNGKIIDEKLKTRLHERREKAKNKERVPSIWRDCLKDELRPNKKVDQGKTRLFTIAPVDFTILTRQMFFDFVMAFYSAQNDTFFSAVGINPESMDWTRLYSYLAEINNEVIAGDYECFDGKEMPEIIEMVGEVMAAWYGGSEEDYNIRMTLFEEIIHTMQLCENTVYMTHMGNPSGNPLTTIINTIVNFSLLALTWLEIFPNSSIDDFAKYVHLKAYGDDNALAVAPKFQDKFHQNSIADALLEHNIVYTSESKSNQEVANFRPLEDITFLKRGFRRDGEFGSSFVLPTMSKETLNSYFYYVRKSTDIQEQLQENQRSALLFAAFHGREFYEDYLQKWKKYMRNANMESLHLSFEEQVDSFLYNAGVLGHSNLTRTGNGIVPEGFDSFMSITNSKPVRIVCGATVAPLYACAALLGIGKTKRTTEPTDDRWAVAIPSGEGKSFLCKTYPWLFNDHDDLLLPKFKENCLSLPWKGNVASQLDFPKDDRRVLLVHHESNTKRRLVGSFITPFPTFIRMNCIQRLKMANPVKLSREDRNILLVQLCSSLEPSLRRNQNGSELIDYTHGSSCLNQLAEHSYTEK